MHKALLAWLEDVSDSLQAPPAGQERTPEALGLRKLPQYSSLDEARRVRQTSSADSGCSDAL